MTSPEPPAPEHGAKRKLRLVLSLDVEEEGLFSGRYSCHAASVCNTAALVRLAPLLERGLKPTLFCAHSVFANSASCRMLERLRDRHGAEIAAHLHHWNTPPLSAEACAAQGGVLAEVPAATVPPELMAAKLATLLRAGQDFQGEHLTSFRMGRWDLHVQLWPLLFEAGLLCDASVRPLHCGKNPAKGPDHFDAPSDPYWLTFGQKRILELPLTVTPLFSALPRLISYLPKSLKNPLAASLSHWGALVLLPIQHPLQLMQLTTLLHAARGGQVLSLTWHSSELFPGGAPHMPDEAAVERFLAKVCTWLDWLEARFDLCFLTLAELHKAAEAGEFVPASPAATGGDWTMPANAENIAPAKADKPEKTVRLGPYAAREGRPAMR